MRTILVAEKNEFKEKSESKSMSYAIKKLGKFYSNKNTESSSVAIKRDAKSGSFITEPNKRGS